MLHSNFGPLRNTLTNINNTKHACNLYNVSGKEVFIHSVSLRNVSFCVFSTIFYSAFYTFAVRTWNQIKCYQSHDPYMAHANLFQSSVTHITVHLSVFIFKSIYYYYTVGHFSVHIYTAEVIITIVIMYSSVIVNLMEPVELKKHQR